MELREDDITKHYPAALALIDGLDHAPRIMDPGEPPLMIIHGQRNETIAFKNAQALWGQAKSKGILTHFHSFLTKGHEVGIVNNKTPGGTVFELAVKLASDAAQGQETKSVRTRH